MFSFNFLIREFIAPVVRSKKQAILDLDILHACIFKRISSSNEFQGSYAFLAWCRFLFRAVLGIDGLLSYYCYIVINTVTLCVYWFL
jgi:hypothetical protein